MNLGVVVRFPFLSCSLLVSARRFRTCVSVSESGRIPKFSEFKGEFEYSSSLCTRVAMRSRTKVTIERGFPGQRRIFYEYLPMKIINSGKCPNRIFCECMHNIPPETRTFTITRINSCDPEGFPPTFQTILCIYHNLVMKHISLELAFCKYFMHIHSQLCHLSMNVRWTHMFLIHS